MSPSGSRHVRQDMNRPRPPASKANRILRNIPKPVEVLLKRARPAPTRLRAPLAVPLHVVVAALRVVVALQPAVVVAVPVAAGAVAAVVAIPRQADLPRLHLSN